MWRADVATFLVAVDARRGVKVGLTVAQVVMLAAGRVRVTDRAARHQLAALLPQGILHLAAAVPEASAAVLLPPGLLHLAVVWAASLRQWTTLTLWATRPLL